MRVVSCVLMALNDVGERIMTQEKAQLTSSCVGKMKIQAEINTHETTDEDLFVSKILGTQFPKYPLLVQPKNRKWQRVHCTAEDTNSEHFPSFFSLFIKHFPFFLFTFFLSLYQMSLHIYFKSKLSHFYLSLPLKFQLHQSLFCLLFCQSFLLVSWLLLSTHKF